MRTTTGIPLKEPVEVSNVRRMGRSWSGRAGGTPVGPAIALALVARPDVDAEPLDPTAADLRACRGRPRGRWPGLDARRSAPAGTRLVALAVVALVALVPAIGWPHLNAGPTTPDRLGLVVVLAADQPLPPRLVAAAEHEAVLAVDWVQDQVGRGLRGDVTSAIVIRLPVDAAELRGSSTAAYRAIVAEVRRQERRRELFPVVLTPISTLTPAGAVQPCARGGVTGLVLFLGNCGDLPSEEAIWGSPISRRIAHELVHGLGAVGDCAPNGTTSGHVLDDPADLMYGGLEEIDPLTTAITLDADRDDYLAHGNEGCPDILDSPLWLG